MNSSSVVRGLVGCALGAVLSAVPALAVEVTLNADQICYTTVGDTVTVTVDLTGASSVVVGGQFFLQYDASALGFVGIAPGDSPFVNEIVELVPGDDGPGTIDYSVGVANGGTGTTVDTTMVVIIFTALSEVCDVANLLTFRAHDPPNRISDEFGGDAGATLIPLSAITVDAMAPAVACPADIEVALGDPTDPIATGLATATDNCDVTPSVGFSDVESVPPAGCPVVEVITRTWVATDGCGHEALCDQTINIHDLDADSDGAANCEDGCPTDAYKTSPGLCGCGVSDIDSDYDTVPNCQDRCSDADDRIDSDGNGIPDCLELESVPTVSTWGIVVMLLVLATVARVCFRRRPRSA